MTRWRWAQALAATLLLGGAIAFLSLGRPAYVRAVRADAVRRGFDARGIRYAAHWPLDFYLPRLARVTLPEQAEAIAADAESVQYFVVPIAGRSSDSVLTQVLRFRIGRWTTALILEYRADSVTVDGADWLPDHSYSRPRAEALEWFAQHGVTERSTTPRS